MSGLCGWLGDGSAQDGAVLQRMGEQLCRLDDAQLSKCMGRVAGIASAGDHRTHCIVEDGDLQLALCV